MNMDGQLNGQRFVRVADAPSVSVLITSGENLAALEASVALLEPACRTRGWQLVVVRSANVDRAQLEAKHAAIRFVDVPPGMSGADMRVIGMAAAEGDIVILGEASQVTPEWVAFSGLAIEPMRQMKPDHEGAAE